MVEMSKIMFVVVSMLLGAVLGKYDTGKKKRENWGREVCV